MRSTQNAARVAGLQSAEAQRINDAVATRIRDASGTPYMPYDMETGDGQASLAMSILRDALEARLAGDFHDIYMTQDEPLYAALMLAVPEARTHDERDETATGFFATYAHAAMHNATTVQLSQWVEHYRARMAGRNSWALDALCRRILRGLADLRAYLGGLAARDRSEHAADAAVEASARLVALRAEARAWHRLSDATRRYVQPGKLTRRERAAKHGHAAKRLKARGGRYVMPNN